MAKKREASNKRKPGVEGADRAGKFHHETDSIDAIQIRS